MDYLSVYINAFNIPSYSAEHHIQYDYIIDAILNPNNSYNNIIDIGSGRRHVIRFYIRCKYCKYSNNTVLFKGLILLL
jgi:hypothetical protein